MLRSDAYVVSKCGASSACDVNILIIAPNGDTFFGMSLASETPASSSAQYIPEGNSQFVDLHVTPGVPSTYYRYFSFNTTNGGSVRVDVSAISGQPMLFVDNAAAGQTPRPTLATHDYAATNPPGDQYLHLPKCGQPSCGYVAGVMGNGSSSATFTITVSDGKEPVIIPDGETVTYSLETEGQVLFDYRLPASLSKLPTAVPIIVQTTAKGGSRNFVFVDIVNSATYPSRRPTTGSADYQSAQNRGFQRVSLQSDDSAFQA